MEKNYTLEKVGKYSYNVKAKEGYKIKLGENDYADEIVCNDVYIDKHLEIVAK